MFVILYGLTDIATIAPFTMLCSKIFGVEQMGVAFGLITFFHQFGAAVGSFIPSILYDMSATYFSTLWLCIGLLIISSILILTVNERERITLSGKESIAVN